MDIESVESGDGRPRRRLLAEVSDDPRSWATASSLVCLGRAAANGAGTSSRDGQLYEEPILRRRFGESYEEFCKRVPRWVPRIRAA